VGYAVLGMGGTSRGRTTNSGLNVGLGVVVRVEIMFATRSALRIRDLLRITNEATIKRRRKIPAAMSEYISKESISEERVIRNENRRCGGGLGKGEVGKGGRMSAFNARPFGSVRVHWRSGRSRPNGRWSMDTYMPVSTTPRMGQPRLELEVIHHQATKRAKGRSGRCRSWKPIDD